MATNPCGPRVPAFIMGCPKVHVGPVQEVYIFVWTTCHTCQVTSVTNIIFKIVFIYFQDIVNNLFTSQNFSTMDVNSDGSLTFDEFFDELMAMPWPIAAGKVII